MARRSSQGGVFRFTAVGAWTLSIFTMLAGPLHAELAGESRHVLLLNSYHRGSMWEQRITRAIEQTFAESEVAVDLTVEYMDTKRFPPQRVFDHLASLYATKYRQSPFEVVIAADNNALAFLQKRRGDIFPRAAVVFCGINNYQPEMIAGQPRMTGLTEETDFAGNYEVILRLLPDTEKIVLVSDSTVTGQNLLAQSRPARKAFQGRVAFGELADMPLEQIARELQSLPERSVVLHLAMFRDSAGQTLSTPEVLRFLAENCPRPVFTTWDFEIQPGQVVGGVVNNAHSQGSQAAGIALQILQGTDPADIPVRREMNAQTNTPMFDYHSLLALGIGEDQLPADAVVVNRPAKRNIVYRPDPFYERYREFIWAALAGFPLLLVLLATLGIYRLKRARSHREMLRVHAGVEGAADAVAIFTPQGRSTYHNKAFLDLLGYTPAQLNQLGGPEALFVDASQGAEAMARVTEGHLWRGDAELRTHGGQTKELNLRLSPILDEQKHLVGIVAFHTDISERKQWEQALRRSEDMLRTTVSAAPIGIGTVSNRVLGWTNQRVSEITGYRPEELQGMPARKLYPSQDEYERVGLIKHGQIKATGVGSVETQWVRKDGTVVDLLLSSASIEGHDVAAGLVFTALDITDRLRTEQALRDSEKLLTDVFDSIRDGISVLNKDLTIRRVNPVMSQWYADSMPLAGKPCHQAYHGHDRSCESCPALEAIRTGQTAVKRLEGQPGQGPECIEVHCFPMRDEATGEVTGVVEYVRDITERRRTEQALQASEERFRALIENTSDVTMILDTEGRYLYVSPAVVNYGVEPGDVLGASGWDRAHPESVPALQEAFTAALANPEQTQRVDRVRLRHPVRPDDSIYQDLLMTYLPKTPGVEGVVINCRDITDRIHAEQHSKLLERQIQHAQKLESLGVLAGGIAHDFNNLLVGILGNADLALADLASSAPARASVEEIKRASRRAAELTNQMLAYSGKGKFVIERVNLNELIDEMEHLLEVSISKKIHLRHQFADALPAVEVDAAQLRQVVMNLITNASDAIGDASGVITIATGTMDADREYLSESYLDDELPPGLYVYMEVSDTGCGMDAETRAKLFEPFFTTKFAGRGLGLAAVLGIIRGHHGAIKVYSEPGQGSTFRLLLPASQKPAPQPVAGPDDGSDAWEPGGTALVADDEPTVVKVAKIMLERIGFDVLTVADGLKAIDAYKQHADDISLVLLDMTMPGRSGEEVFREMRRIRPDVRVILTSGYNEQDATNRFAGKGLAGFIQKPFELSKLRDAVRAAMNLKSGDNGDDPANEDRPPSADPSP